MIDVGSNNARTATPDNVAIANGLSPAQAASHSDTMSQRDDTLSILVQLSGLSKEYLEAGQRRLVLDHLDRDFRIGEFVCLLGKSGSGKSTLLNLISGIDEPSSGEDHLPQRRIRNRPHCSQRAETNTVQTREYGHRVSVFQSDPYPNRTRKRDAAHGTCGHRNRT